MKIEDFALDRIKRRASQLQGEADPNELLVPHLFGKALNEHLNGLLSAMTDPTWGHLNNDGGFRHTLGVGQSHSPG